MYNKKRVCQHVVISLIVWNAIKTFIVKQLNTLNMKNIKNIRHGTHNVPKVFWSQLKSTITSSSF